MIQKDMLNIQKTLHTEMKELLFAKQYYNYLLTNFHY
jgi:hypothetical protein